MKPTGSNPQNGIIPANLLLDGTAAPTTHRDEAITSGHQALKWRIAPLRMATAT
jgi:hypothetical protein